MSQLPRVHNLGVDTRLKTYLSRSGGIQPVAVRPPRPENRTPLLWSGHQERLNTCGDTAVYAGLKKDIEAPKRKSCSSGRICYAGWDGQIGNPPQRFRSGAEASVATYKPAFPI